MKLRNKETREIRPAETREDGIYLYDDVTEEWYKFELPLLAKYWEYYEEPEGIIKVEKSIVPTCVHIEYATEEEAERAVGKLKEITEAKRDGLKIKGYYYNHEDLVILADIGKCNKLTLDTLFGKEID